MVRISARFLGIKTNMVQVLVDGPQYLHNGTILLPPVPRL